MTTRFAIRGGHAGHRDPNTRLLVEKTIPIRRVEGKVCDWCGRGLTYTPFRPNEPEPYGITMCVACVNLGLVGLTVRDHGDVGERPWSNVHQDHAGRMYYLSYLREPGTRWEDWRGMDTVDGEDGGNGDAQGV